MTVMAISTRGPADDQKTSIPSLFAAVIEDARDLAIGHLERMQHETAGELKNLKHALARTAVAVAIVIVGAVLGGHAIAQGLIELGLLPWAGYAIAAGAGILGGLILLSRFPKDRTDLDLVPEEAIASLQRDAKYVKDATAQPA